MATVCTPPINCEVDNPLVAGITKSVEPTMRALSALPVRVSLSAIIDPRTRPFPLILIIGLLFYFVLLQPERKRRRQHEEMLAKLKKNDRVLVLGGIYGTVVNVNKDAGDVTIKVDESSNARIRITRSSISQIVEEAETKEK